MANLSIGFSVKAASLEIITILSGSASTLVGNNILITPFWYWSTATAVKTHWSQKRLLTPPTADIMFLEKNVSWDMISPNGHDWHLFIFVLVLIFSNRKCIRLLDIKLGSWAFLWWDFGIRSSTFQILSTCFWPSSSRASPSCQAPRQAGPEQGSRASCPHDMSQ